MKWRPREFGACPPTLAAPYGRKRAVIVLAILGAALASCDERERFEVGGQAYCVPEANVLDGVPALFDFMLDRMTEHLPGSPDFGARVEVVLEDKSPLRPGEGARSAFRHSVTLLISDVKRIAGYRSLQPDSPLVVELNGKAVEHLPLRGKDLIRSDVSYSPRYGDIVLWKYPGTSPHGGIEFTSTSEVIAVCPKTVRPAASHSEPDYRCKQFAYDEGVSISYSVPLRLIDYWPEFRSSILASVQAWHCHAGSE